MLQRIEKIDGIESSDSQKIVQQSRDIFLRWNFFETFSLCNLQIDLFSNRLDKNQDSSISDICRIDSSKFANLCIARNSK